MTAPLIYLLAGEVSGDLLGGRLMAALRAQRGGELRFAGVGGAAMAAEGLNSLFPMNDVSLMGIAEILPHLPNLLRRLKQTEADLRARGPSVLVTIDAPAFTLRISERIADLGVPRIHYVAPQVWAWRPGRAKRLARKTDRLLTLLPFEPPYFTRYGLPADYTGHPVIEGEAGQGDGAGFRRRHGLPMGVPLLVVLLGSRGAEVRRLAAVFGQTAARLVARRPNLRLVLPAVEPVSEAVRAAVAAWPGQPLIVEGDQEKFDAFAAGTAALAASGTVALELALAGLPMVIAYRLNWLTWQMARRLVKVPYASLVNLILQRACVPEYLQEACSPVGLARALEDLLMPDSGAAHQQKEGFVRLREKLGLGAFRPSERAAQLILSSLRS